MNSPTIENAKIIPKQTENGTTYFEIYADEGYAIYSVSEYKRNCEDGYPEATYFCKYISCPESPSLYDIATMPESEAEKIMNILKKE